MVSVNNPPNACRVTDVQLCFRVSRDSDPDDCRHECSGELLGALPGYFIHHNHRVGSALRAQDLVGHSFISLSSANVSFRLVARRSEDDLMNMYEAEKHRFLYSSGGTTRSNVSAKQATNDDPSSIRSSATFDPASVRGDSKK